MGEQIEARETSPLDRCEVCDAPGEWRAEYSAYDVMRRPPYRFFDRVFCAEHLPDDARAVIEDWVPDDHPAR